MKISDNKGLFFFIPMALLIAIISMRCTPEKKFQVLSFFFDGVPNPAEQVAVIKDTINNNENLTGNAVSQVVKIPSLVHRPYAEEMCKSCHINANSNDLILPIPQLCYSCHEDFNNKFKVMHGPAAAGYCKACHHPHEGNFPKLLLLDGQALCFNCHNSKDILANKIHSTIGTKKCTECHNPHGADNRGFLSQGICYNCHDNFNLKYNTLHGPVASGNCASCHGSHSSGVAKLLLREKQELCLFCHDATQVFNSPGHLTAKKENCTKCHNPHGGEDRFVLLESIRPYITKPGSRSKFNSTKGDTALANINSVKRDSSIALQTIALPKRATYAGNLLIGENFSKPLANVKVNLVNEKSETIQSVYTNALGAFIFNNLPSEQNFVVKVAENDLPLDIKTIKMTNQNGKEINTIHSENGGFDFSFLSMESHTLAAIETEEVTIAGNLLFGETHPKPLINKKLNLVTTNGEIIKSVITDTNGAFVFTHIPDDLKLALKVEENGLPLAANETIQLVNQSGKAIQSILAGSKEGFKFSILASDSTKIAKEETEDIVISGNLMFGERKQKPLVNTEVNLVNENGVLFESTFTNEQGEFAFYNLPADQYFLIKINEKDAPLLAKTKVKFTNQNTKEVKTIQTGKKGGFEFLILPSESKTLSKVEMSDVSITGNLLFGDNSTPLAKSKVNLINEKGEVVSSTTTDTSGAFIFTNLPSDQNFLLKVDESETRLSPNLKIKITNQEGKEIQTTHAGSNGDFEFSLLPAESLPLAKVENGDLSISGNLVFGEKNAKPLSNTKINLVNEKGEVFKTYITDTSGRFDFSNLSIEHNYLVQIVEIDSSLLPNTKISFIARNGKTVHTAITTTDASFKISFLAYDYTSIKALPIEDLWYDTNRKIISKPKQELKETIFDTKTNGNDYTETLPTNPIQSAKNELSSDSVLSNKPKTTEINNGIGTFPILPVETNDTVAKADTIKVDWDNPKNKTNKIEKGKVSIVTKPTLKSIDSSQNNNPNIKHEQPVTLNQIGKEKDTVLNSIIPESNTSKKTKDTNAIDTKNNIKLPSVHSKDSSITGTIKKVSTPLKEKDTKKSEKSATTKKGALITKKSTPLKTLPVRNKATLKTKAPTKSTTTTKKESIKKNKSAVAKNMGEVKKSSIQELQEQTTNAPGIYRKVINEEAEKYSNPLRIGKEKPKDPGPLPTWSNVPKNPPVTDWVRIKKKKGT